MSRENHQNQDFTEKIMIVKLFFSYLNLTAAWKLSDGKLIKSASLSAQKQTKQLSWQHLQIKNIYRTLCFFFSVLICFNSNKGMKEAPSITVSPEVSYLFF